MNARVQPQASAMQTKERDHIVLVDTIARNADTTNKNITTINGHTTGKNLNTVS